MKCPACHFPDTKVTDSRTASDGLVIRRRRECLQCGFRFSTYEEVEILNLVVVKRDGRKEPYDRGKLESGLKKAFEKRPMTADDFKRAVNLIERDIQLIGKPEVTTRQIGELVMRHLKRLDQVAYIRFASVYRSFTDVEHFRKTLQGLTAKPRKTANKTKKRKQTARHPARKKSARKNSSRAAERR